MRVKVPRFDGSGAEDWIYKMNKFFELHNVSSEMRLATVAFHLEGAPSTWYHWMEKGVVFQIGKRFYELYDLDSALQSMRILSAG